VEAFALGVLDQLASGQVVEDSRVELKREWPEPEAKIARVIAGLCNATRGQRVYLFVGVDEKAGRVVGAGGTDPASWWQKVASHFDGPVPDLTQSLCVRHGEASAYVLEFETYRAPFVVKNPRFGKPEGGPVEREVPWRVGTSVRSATHEDLIRVLVPSAPTPTFEALSLRSRGANNMLVGDEHHLVEIVEVVGYLDCDPYQVLVIPYHRCSGRVTWEGGAFEWVGFHIGGGALDGQGEQNGHVEPTWSQVRVQGPAMLQIGARLPEEIWVGSGLSSEKRGIVEVRLELPFVGGDSPIRVAGRFSWAPKRFKFSTCWELASTATNRVHG